MDQADIKNFTLAELEKSFALLGEPAYRARQAFSWVYKKGADDFSQMRNLPGGLIEKLKKNYYIGTLERAGHKRSKEGVEKFLFRLSDGNYIETVLIHSKDRSTVCLSTQAGCKFACAFCASGRIGFIRDLSVSEILNQILFIQHKHKEGITNCVFMGMGEPLDNYDNTAKAVSIINDPQAIGIGARKITVSTCGVIPGVRKLTRLRPSINLSLSLHAGNDALRSELMPVNKKYPLAPVIKACRDYLDSSKRLLTLEYVLIKNKNDSLRCADELALIAQKLRAKVNLIAYSRVRGVSFRPPDIKDINLFMDRLRKRNVGVTLRRSKGADIEAACGQLAGRQKD